VTEKINLELLGARVMTLTTEVRDLRHRFTAFRPGKSVDRDGGPPERHRKPTWRHGGPHVVDALANRQDRRPAPRKRSIIPIRLAGAWAPRCPPEPRRRTASEVHKKLC